MFDQFVELWALARPRGNGRAAVNAPALRESSQKF
jgi:hypothetical protein